MVMKDTLHMAVAMKRVRHRVFEAILFSGRELSFFYREVIDTKESIMSRSDRKTLNLNVIKYELAELNMK